MPEPTNQDADEAVMDLFQRLFGDGDITGFCFGESGSASALEAQLRAIATDDLLELDSETRLQAARGHHGVLVVSFNGVLKYSFTANQVARCLTGRDTLPLTQTEEIQGQRMSLFIASPMVDDFRAGVHNFARLKWAPQTQIVSVESGRKNIVVWPIRKGERLVQVLVGGKPILGARPHG